MVVTYFIVVVLIGIAAFFAYKYFSLWKKDRDKKRND